MSPTSHDSLNSTTTLEEKPIISTPISSLNGGSGVSATRPYAPEKDKQEPSLKERASVFLGGGVILTAILLLAFGRLLHTPAPGGKTSLLQPKKVTETTKSTESKVPLTDEGQSATQHEGQEKLGPEQIASTATKHPAQAPANLAGIQPFDDQHSWEPPAYNPNSQNTDSAQNDNASVQDKATRDTLDKASLVFVHNKQSSGAPTVPDNTPLDVGIGLPPGAKLRARIESAVSTAVQAPVIAVVEYNYERNGEIIVPAGAKAFGHLESADQSGYVGVRFDSLMMPDGSLIDMQAAATDLQLRPLKGRVEGRHRGQNILVRSFAGLGEIAAALVGRGSLDQSLSEGDLLRERAVNNIAQASDEQVSRLAITEHTVVTVAANTEIYVVLQKPAKTKEQPDLRSPQARVASTSSSTDQLRQLLQLQQELNQQSTTRPAQ